MNFPTKKYSIIYADPPWKYSDSLNNGCRGASHKYRVMSVEEICKLPVKSISKRNSCLFLWTTSAFLFDSLKVINSWGFNYKTIGFVWIKSNKRGKGLFFGLGHWTRANAEFCLLCFRGKMKRKSASISQVLISPIRSHSEKPDKVRDLIVELIGNKSRIELFARRRFHGWDCWGDEI